MLGGGAEPIGCLQGKVQFESSPVLSHTQFFVT